MTATWLAAIIILGGSPANLPQLADLATAAQASGEPALVLAIAEIESGFEPGVRSSKGACCWMGLLGGRYGHSSCKALEASADLCVREAVEELEDWKISCANAYLDAYNAGWRRCWAGRHRKASSCKGATCKSYGERVARNMAAIEAIVTATTTTQVTCVVAGKSYHLTVPTAKAAKVVARSKGLCLDGSRVRQKD